MKTYENALQIIADNYAIIGKERHELAAMVIDKYKSSTEPFDILGVAYAYLWQGAKFRQDAISYFEKYLSEYSDIDLNCHCIKRWSVYSDLATLYEKEYKYQKAIFCLQKCIAIDDHSNAADYTRIGDILVKEDMSKAEEFYVKLLNDTKLNKYQRQFAYALNEVIEKKNRGYVYRPRNKKQ